MKRNMELVIRILKVIEENESGDSFTLSMNDEGYDNNTVQYHLRLMSEADLITVIDTTTFDGEEYIITGMTWEGHDFLDAARNDAVVEKAKEIAKKQGVELFNLPLQIAKDLLVEGAKSLFN